MRNRRDTPFAFAMLGEGLSDYASKMQGFVPNPKVSRWPGATSHLLCRIEEVADQYGD
jgi:hypothetical protein